MTPPDTTTGPPRPAGRGLTPGRSFALGTALLGGLLLALWWYQASGPRTIRVGDCYVLAVTFSPDGRTLATGDSDGRLKLWEFASGHLSLSVQAHAGAVFNVGFDADGRSITTQGDWSRNTRREDVKFWDVLTGSERPRAGRPEPWAVDCPAGVRRVQLREGAEPPGRLTAWLCDARGEELLTVEGHPHHMNCLAFSPDAKLLATGSGATSGGSHVMPWNNGELRVWDVQSGELLATRNRHWAPIMAVAFSPDGKTLASGGCDGTVRLWSVEKLVGQGRSITP